jgi:hypothetical protein
VVGLVSLRDERLGTLSRGMDRRLGLAGALLADPHTLVLDDPADGLSARESRWLYGMLRAHADQGGTVLLTAADPKEAARTADRVVTLEQGRLVADQEAADFSRTRLRPRVAVRTPHPARLAALLTKEARTAQRSVEVVREGGNRLSVYGSTCADVGETAFRHGILVHQLADEIGDMGPGAGADVEDVPRTAGEPLVPDGHALGVTRGAPQAVDGESADGSSCGVSGESPRTSDGESAGGACGESGELPRTSDGEWVGGGACGVSDRSPLTPDGETARGRARGASAEAPQAADGVRPGASAPTAAKGTPPKNGTSCMPDDESARSGVCEGAAEKRQAREVESADTATRAGSADEQASADRSHPSVKVHPSAGTSAAPSATDAGPTTGPATEPWTPAADTTAQPQAPVSTTGATARTPRGTDHPAQTAPAAGPGDTPAVGRRPQETPRSHAPTRSLRPAELPALPPPISVRPAPSPLRPLRYELRRAAGIGTGFLTGAAVLVVSALTAVLLARIGHTPQPRLLAAWPQELPLPPAALGAGLLGALAFGDEFRHPALAADRGTVPRQLGLLTAKLLVSGATALLLAFLTVGCDAEVLYLVYGRELAQVPADWLSLSASWLGLVVGCAWAGVLAAGVFRSTTAGLAAVVAVPLLVVPLVQKALAGPSVRSAAGLPLRLREVFLLQWPFGGERYLAAAARVIAQPVGGALALSLTALLCAYLLTTLRSRVR